MKIHFAKTISVTMLGLTALSPIAFADTPAPTAGATTPAAPIDPNTLVATVNGQKITLAQVQTAIAALPPQARQLQPSTIVPLVVDQVIEQKAIQISAERSGLQNNPAVKTAMENASNSALENAYLEKQVNPQVTEAAMKSYYQTHYANQKPQEEVHARHILVKTEAEADAIITKLNHGGDFATLAAQNSQDKVAAANGGDLGWFKKGDMIPAFSDAAFAMKPGTFSQKAVHTQYGWHVIKVDEKRTAPIPSFDDVKPQIRRDLVREDVRKVVSQAMASVKVVRYDTNGKALPSKPAAPAK